MFKRFLQNNIFLVSLLGASLALGALLIVLAISKRMEMQDVQEQMKKLREKIGELHRGPVHSVRENLTRLQRDRLFYEKCVQKVEKIYGYPMQDALDKMAKSVALVDEKTKKADFADGDSMRRYFMAFYNEKKSSNTKGQIYDTFRREHSENWSEAMRTFVQEVDSLTQEPINNTNKDEVLLALLGLPRDCDGSVAQANAVIETVHRRLDDLYAKNKITVAKAATDYGVPQMAAADRNKIIHSLEALEFSSNLAARIAKSGITSLDLMQLTSDSPAPQDGFLYYDFRIRVTGSLASIREAVNQLNAAFSERRIYVVQSLELSRTSLEAEKILNRRLGMESERKKSGRKRGVVSASHTGEEPEEETKVAELEESKLPYNERKGYAEPVLGCDNLCRADLNVIYVVRMQDKLE